MADKRSETQIKKMGVPPEQRVQQAQVRLLEAAKAVDEKPVFKFKLKENIGMSTVVFAFAAGFITGFSPSVSQTVSREATSLLRLWLGHVKSTGSDGESASS